MAAISDGMYAAKLSPRASASPHLEPAVEDEACRVRARIEAQRDAFASAFARRGHDQIDAGGHGDPADSYEPGRDRSTRASGVEQRVRAVGLGVGGAGRRTATDVL